MHDDEEFCGEEEIELLRSAVSRKLNEIDMFRERLSQSDSEESKKKYENIIDFIYSDIIGYRTAISEITGEELNIVDLEYDVDITPDYDAEEVYDTYIQELDEESRNEDVKQMGLKAEFFSDYIDGMYYNVATRTLTEESLREEILKHDSVLVEMGKVIMEHDFLRKLFL